MARTQVDDAGELLALADRQRAEIAVVSQHGSTLRVGMAKDLAILLSCEPFGENGDDSRALGGQRIDDFGMDVFVGQQRKFERLHAVTGMSQTTSLRIVFAAY